MRLFHYATIPAGKVRDFTANASYLEVINFPLFSHAFALSDHGAQDYHDNHDHHDDGDGDDQVPN